MKCTKRFNLLLTTLYNGRIYGMLANKLRSCCAAIVALIGMISFCGLLIAMMYFMERYTIFHLVLTRSGRFVTCYPEFIKLAQQANVTVLVDDVCIISSGLHTLIFIFSIFVILLVWDRLVTFIIICVDIMLLVLIHNFIILLRLISDRYSKTCVFNTAMNIYNIECYNLLNYDMFIVGGIIFAIFLFIVFISMIVFACIDSCKYEYRALKSDLNTYDLEAAKIDN